MSKTELPAFCASIDRGWMNNVLNIHSLLPAGKPLGSLLNGRGHTISGCGSLFIVSHSNRVAWMGRARRRAVRETGREGVARPLSLDSNPWTSQASGVLTTYKTSPFFYGRASWSWQYAYVSLERLRHSPPPSLSQCMYVCMCVCMYVCMCVCVCVSPTGSRFHVRVRRYAPGSILRAPTTAGQGQVPLCPIYPHQKVLQQRRSLQQKGRTFLDIVTCMFGWWGYSLPSSRPLALDYLRTFALI